MILSKTSLLAANLNVETSSSSTGKMSGTERKTESVRAQVLNTIRAHMPISSLFKPELKIDLGVFIKDQVLFRLIATFISQLAGQTPVTVETVKKHFEGSGLLKEISKRFTNPEPYFPIFYQACFDALNNKNSPSRLRVSIEGGIHTFTDALSKAEGASFIRESIQMHLAALSEKSSEESFQNQLTDVAGQLIPFIEKVTKSYLQDRGLEAKDPVLQQRPPKGYNFHAITAAAVMECCLRVLGYEAELTQRTDLEPRVTRAAVHSNVIVTGPDQSRYVVDPCYLQFHKDVVLDDANLPKDPVLVLKESEVAPYVEKNLLKPWQEIHARYLKNDLRARSTSNDQLVSHGFAEIDNFEEKFKFRPEEWIKKSFERPFACQGYARANSYPVYNAIFIGEKSLAQKTYHYVKSMGIGPLVGRASISEVERKLSAISTNPLRLGKNDLEAISLIPQLDVTAYRYPEFLDIDPRHDALSLDHEINAYFRSLCKIVNPERKEVSVIYACSGSDCTSVLLATDATEIFFVDISGASIGLLKQNLKNLKKSPLDKTKGWRYHACANDCAMNKMDAIEMKLILDLKMMGIDLTKVKITSLSEGVQIEFPWESFEKPVKMRTLFLLQADITKPEEYPAILKEKITTGFDIFYMKGAFHLPLEYSKFLPNLAQGLKTGGWLMTADWTHDMRYANPQDCLRESFKESTSEENEALKRLVFSNKEDIFFTYPNMESTDRTELYIHSSLLYWSILNLRQKQGQIVGSG